MPNIALLKSFTIWFKSIKTSKGIDFFAVLILSSIAIIISLKLSANCPNIFYEKYNVWFGSDINRAYDNLVNSQSFGHTRTHVHPIFSIIMIPLVGFFSFFGISDLNTAYLLIALSGAIVTSLLYLTLRFNGLSILSSLLCSAVFLSSGSFIFWWSVVETFPIGGATISIIFLLIAMGNKSKWIWAVSTALTLGITITNWIVGIIGALQTFKKVTAIKILVIGFVSILILYSIQSFVFPEIKLLRIGDRLTNESKFLIIPESFADVTLYLKKYFRRSIAFFVSPAVVSKTILGNNPNHVAIRPDLFKYSIFGWLSISCWFTLLIGGLVRIFQSRPLGKLAKTLLLFILFQFLLHMFYGDRPFIYSAHYTAALVIISSYSLHGKYAKVFQLVAFVFCVSAMYSNVGNFNHAMVLLHK